MNRHRGDQRNERLHFPSFAEVLGLTVLLAEFFPELLGKTDLVDPVL